MEVSRIVPIPLARDPEVLFGLRLFDTFWIGLGIAGDLMVWHTVTVRDLRYGSMAVLSLAALAMAVVRIEEASLPAWALRIMGYWARPRRYLP